MLVVDVDVVMDVARKVAAGDMTEDEGRAYLDLMAEDDGTPGASPPDTAAALAEVEGALDTLTERNR